jgi:hypothetical protein
MWTVSDTGMLVNLEAVRSIDIEISDDRQWVEVQVRWTDGGERAAIVSLVVRDYGDVRAAVAVARTYVDVIRRRITDDGDLVALPIITPHDELKIEAPDSATDFDGLA